MSWTLADVTAIEAALKTGVLRVRYSTHEVQYQSLDLMMKLRDQMVAELNDTAGSAVVYAGRIG